MSALLDGLELLQTVAHLDPRGAFSELHRDDVYRARGVGPFVQDNLSRSRRGVVRGLHFQQPTPQGKLVMVVRGAIFDVAVDLRPGSPTFGRWSAVELTGLDRGGVGQLWIPPGFAHGFQALSDEADVLYKCTAPYVAGADRAIAWDDPDLAIAWPLADAIVSARDAAAPRLRDAPVLPR